MDELTEKDLNAATIAHNLGTKFIGQKVIYFPSLPSTMDEARREAKNGAPEGTVVIAGIQTAGRGRLKRRWLSPQGSIALSVILYPQRSYLPFLVMIASLAVVYSIEKIADLKTLIKWPNDVFLNGKKVCGILIETDVQSDRVKYAIVGIGINANIKITGLDELKETATSLSGELGHEVSRLELARQILIELERLYLALPAPEPVYREWRDKLFMLGKKVKLISGDTALEGIAESVTLEGNLMLRLADGRVTPVIAGDVTYRYTQ
jgi:BirA family biotin operon repressor/biotin-[acetyl-CoA-carboxylase] ligase